MSDDFDLTKQSADFILTKRSLHNVRARVGNALDVSGSIQPLYFNGTMQRYLNRGLALALRLDDNGALDTWVFDNAVTALKPVTEADVRSYVQREIMPLRDIWQGTLYAPPLRAAAKHWFRPGPTGFVDRWFGRKRTASSDTTPALLLFWTDGNNSYEEQAAKSAERAMEEIAKYPLYIAFIGVGDHSFQFIKQTAKKYDNVGCLIVPQSKIETISDDDLYEQLVTDEMANWLRSHQGT